ncbi:MAG: tetratricopeptide repeat protein [Atopobiaceae bacterium]|nr:tetratricopeptide repeat protein [Atopobiaceae bacterium]
MKRQSIIDHLLFVLVEVALFALLIGCADASLQGAGLLTCCGAIASTSLLVTAIVLHGRLVQSDRRQKGIHAQRTVTTYEPAPGEQNVTALGVRSDSTGGPENSPAGNPSVSALDTPVLINDSTLALEAASDTGDSQTPDDEALSPSQQLEEVSPAKQKGHFDFSAFCDDLVASSDPIAQLKQLVGDIRTREADNTSGIDEPTGIERYAARMLEEAGLFAKDVKLPDLTATRLASSGMLYLRCGDPQIPYLAKLRIIRLEAALNAIRFAHASLPHDASIKDAYLLNQGLARSIVAQAAPIDEPFTPSEDDPWPEGEWTVRYGISHAIETLQLPYRLTARYRTNVADGNVAIEMDLTPAELFPSSCYVEGLGIVPSTGDMRQQAVADYTLRLALLLAASAFRCSNKIKHVWVAVVNTLPTRRSCYLSVDFDRWRFSHIDLTDLGDLAETYRAFAPVMRYEGGWLRAVKQSFHLEEERFCPKRRYLPVSLSSRRLDEHTAKSLGTDHVSGLSIEEGDGRTLVANAIMMRLIPEDDAKATERNVRTVMNLAGDDPDPTVRSAAERVVRKLVDGSLGTDALTLGEEFVRGDTLTRANDRAKECLMKQRPDQAIAALAPVMRQIDDAQLYDDSPSVIYRYFNSYIERAMFNRMHAEESTAAVMLVPDAYYEGHLLLSILNLMRGSHEEALRHAQRLVSLAPLDTRARLHMVKCLEVLDRDDEAIAQLVELLEKAHDPQGVGLAYYRMAFFQWKRGKVAAAQACYQLAMRLLPDAMPMMAMELSVLMIQNPDALQAEVSDQQIEDALAANGIPLAPTDRTSEIFYDCARASLDAEVFPVARNFARVMAAFTNDDIITGIAGSLEDEPDR